MESKGMEKDTLRAIDEILANSDAVQDAQADFNAALKEARTYLEHDLVQDLEDFHQAVVDAVAQAVWEATGRGESEGSESAAVLEAFKTFLQQPAIQRLIRELQEPSG